MDASVAVKWVVLEEGRGEALRRTAGLELAGPDFVLVEAANILWARMLGAPLLTADRQLASLGGTPEFPVELLAGVQP